MDDESGETALAAGTEAAPELPFYIAATGPAARPRHALKHNDTFAVLDSHGDIGAAAGGPDGLFTSDTRFLSHLELLLNGGQPLLLGANVRDDNLHLYVDLTNPDIYLDGALALGKDSVHVGRTIYLKDGAMRQRILVVNHSLAEVRLPLAFTFDSDFADIFEVRGMRRPHRGRSRRRVVGEADIVFSYEGLDGKLRETSLCFSPAPDTLLPTTATYRLVLPPQGRATIFMAVSCFGLGGQPAISFLKDLAGAHRDRRGATQRRASIETANGVLNEVLRRAQADLDMLRTDTKQGPYPYAGIPWYSTTFGRDGLIGAMQMLWLDPALAKGVLCRLAHFQAKTADPGADAEPGKILHEMRGGEMASVHEVPFGLYYGSIDSTPLFIVLAALYAERTGDDDLLKTLWSNIEAGLSWIDTFGDRDGDGFIEYARAVETGLSNQGWKDSYDAVFHADGRLADGPIALAEAQAYVFAAKRLAARAARRLGLVERAEVLAKQAAELRDRFERHFWSEPLGLYVLALDGAKAPCQVKSSNGAHVLFAGIASAERAGRVAAACAKPELFSGWGIRTIATDEPRYNPLSYHNGSIWPHDNAMIARGFARYGLKREIEPIFEGLAQAAAYMDHRRLPELFCGFRRRRGRGPTLYPVACSPQTWAAGSIFMCLEALLGLEFDADARLIRLRNPFVPALAGEIAVTGLRLGNGSADFVVRRGRHRATLDVLGTTGDLSVTLAHGPVVVE